MYRDGTDRSRSFVGYHVPATRRRDLFYAKLEREREDNHTTV